MFGVAALLGMPPAVYYTYAYAEPAAAGRGDMRCSNDGTPGRRRLRHRDRLRPTRWGCGRRFLCVPVRGDHNADGRCGRAARGRRRFALFHLPAHAHGL